MEGRFNEFKYEIFLSLLILIKCLYFKYNSTLTVRYDLHCVKSALTNQPCIVLYACVWYVGVGVEH